MSKAIFYVQTEAGEYLPVIPRCVDFPEHAPQPKTGKANTFKASTMLNGASVEIECSSPAVEDIFTRGKKIVQRIRELNAAIRKLRPSCMTCKWCEKERCGKPGNVRGRIVQWHCKAQRDHFWLQPDKQALKCEHYKRKGKNK